VLEPDTVEEQGYLTFVFNDFVFFEKSNQTGKAPGFIFSVLAPDSEDCRVLWENSIGGRDDSFVITKGRISCRVTPIPGCHERIVGLHDLFMGAVVY
jgi:hypothetical protein